jgi:hypothetical protein
MTTGILTQPTYSRQMDELFIGLISVVVEVLGEASIEIAGELVVDLLVRVSKRIMTAAPGVSPLFAVIGIAILGALSGLLSITIFPHPMVHPSRVHGASLLISPLVAGLVMSLIGRGVRGTGRESIQIESFGYGFIFAFAMALIRLMFVR